jgi:cyclic pyranopterin phosphate synthase
MPREVFGPDFAFLPRSEILTFEEIARLARIFAGLGVQKFRLTGGEPTLRNGLATLIAMLDEIPDTEIAMTTNGSLLKELAEPLAKAGLDRVTVSLDSLDDEVFRAMNYVGFPVSRVL